MEWRLEGAVGESGKLNTKGEPECGVAGFEFDEVAET